MGGGEGGSLGASIVCSQAAQEGLRVRPGKGLDFVERLHWRISGLSGIGRAAGRLRWPQPMEHQEHPHQGDQPELVENEMGYHGTAPSHRW